MSTLLLGDPTPTYTQPDALRVSLITYQAAWKFTAVASGTVTDLWFRTSSTANTGLTGLRLGIYQDTAGAPTALLGQGTAGGEPGTDTWITVSGLSVPVLLGVDYWLAVLPLGTNDVTHRIHYNTAVVSGGTAGVDAQSGGGETTATFLSPWTTFDPDNDDALTNGPVGFRALGDVSAADQKRGVEIGLTTLHYPEKTTSPTHDVIPARVLDWAMDPEGLLLTVPRNERRTAEVSFSFDDDICRHLYRVVTETATNHEVQITTAYEVLLFIRWRGHPVFWGPVVHMDWRGAERRVTVSATDVQRLIDHQIHVGDEALDPDGVTLGGFGFDRVIGAADLTGLQETDGTPAHGIQPPGNSGSNTLSVKSTLDDGVWDKLVEMSTYEGAPDFSVVPYDIEDYPGDWYAKFTTYPDGQGDPDAHERLKLQAGGEMDNAESVDWSPGGTYMTHAVVRNQSNTSRVIQANVDARRRTGPYVHVENIQSDSADGTMTARAEMLIKAYSQPVDSHSVVLRNDLPPLTEGDGRDHPGSLHYLDDFDLGDTITVEVHDAWFDKRVIGQINEVRLRQDGQEIKQEIDVVPELVGILDLSEEQV